MKTPPIQKRAVTGFGLIGETTHEGGVASESRAEDRHDANEGDAGR
ncbi:MAG: hypothetical protein IT578_11575 [Verrucomicrobiae bacterium]|nr:hypothetical protein [Verrucomicrobiae bacterium]